MKNILSASIIFLFLLTLPVLSFAEAGPFMEGIASLKQNNTGSRSVIDVKLQFIFPSGYYQANQPEYFNLQLIGVSPKDSTITYPEIDKFRDVTIVTAQFKVDGPISFPYSNNIVLNYQLCDESGTCFFPKSNNFLIKFNTADEADSGVGFSLSVPDYPQFNTQSSEDSFSFTKTENSTLNNSPEYVSVHKPSVISIIAIIFFAFIGGVLLNIMPCVLPVLSLKALHLVSLSKTNAKVRIREGVLYSLGIITSLFVLGALAATLKAFGEIAGWGFQFQNPFFTVSLSFTVFLFALSMFDIYIFNLPGLTIAEKSSHKSGNIGTYLSGVFAVLLATPCTAPFMGSALGLAFTLGPLVIVSAFIAIGAGLALPFFLLSIFPQFLRWIPKPGNWMNIFKQFLGFLLLATLGWLLNSAYYQIGWNGILKLFFILLAAAFILWYFGTLQKSGKHILTRKILLVLLLAFVILGIWLTGSSENKSNTAIKKGWQTFSSETLEKERVRGNPVFVAFSAEWCLTCKTNETTVLNTKEIQNFFDQNNVTLLYGDFTNNDPVIAEWITKYGRSGVPVYVYYPPYNSDYIVLPEILTKTVVKNIILQGNIPK